VASFCRSASVAELKKGAIFGPFEISGKREFCTNTFGISDQVAAVESRRPDRAVSASIRVRRRRQWAGTPYTPTGSANAILVDTGAKAPSAGQICYVNKAKVQYALCHDIQQYVVTAAVRLAGITAAQFDATAQTNFKTVVATYLTICGTNGATQCAASDVTIVSSVRRGVAVTFRVTTTSSTRASTGATSLNTAITTNAATFKSALVAKGGNLASVTGSTTTTAPAAGTFSVSSAPHAHQLPHLLLAALATMVAAPLAMGW